MGSSPSVRFSEDDLKAFAKASGDRNPLHLSSDYASRTAYGQQVVFGAMGCVASLGAVQEVSRPINRVVADFHRPMFLEVDYRLESTESRDGLLVRLLDGSVPVVTTTVRFGAEHREPSSMPDRPIFPLDTPRLLSWTDLNIGQEIGGEYRCDAAGLRELYKRWLLKLDPLVVETLLWSSYFVGMEVPGQSALFFRAAIDFHDSPDPDTAFLFKGTIKHLNVSIMKLKTTFELTSCSKTAATGQLTSFVRPELPELSFDSVLADSQSDRFEGKVAIVLGASRGLGAALAMTLASEGAQVIAVARSTAKWIEAFPPVMKERITVWEGDIRNTECLSALAEMISRNFQRLDLAFFSAFPAIPSLRLEPSARERVLEYIGRATDLVLAPLCELIPQLSKCNGCAVLISSAAVESPVRDWPHYVAAKTAAESIFRIAPMQFPEISALIVRPERLLTEMTNTPMGRQGATSPLLLARQITEVLPAQKRVGRCEVLDLQSPVQLAEKIELLEQKV